MLVLNLVLRAKFRKLASLIMVSCCSPAEFEQAKSAKNVSFIEKLRLQAKFSTVRRFLAPFSAAYITCSVCRGRQSSSRTET